MEGLLASLLRQSAVLGSLLLIEVVVYDQIAQAHHWAYKPDWLVNQVLIPLASGVVASLVAGGGIKLPQLPKSK